MIASTLNTESIDNSTRFLESEVPRTSSTGLCEPGSSASLDLLLTPRVRKLIESQNQEWCNSDQIGNATTTIHGNDEYLDHNKLQVC